MNIREKEIWRSFGEQIHQDFISEHGSFADGLVFLFESMKTSDLNTLKLIINDLLSESFTRESRYFTWIDSGASFAPEKKKIDEFLIEISGILNCEM